MTNRGCGKRGCRIIKFPEMLKIKRWDDEDILIEDAKKKKKKKKPYAKAA